MNQSEVPPMMRSLVHVRNPGKTKGVKWE